jgi:hypothetical protein
LTEAAQLTIRLLRLDLPKLVRLRPSAIDGMLTDLDDSASAPIASVADLDERDDAGRYLPFCSALISVSSSYGNAKE